MMVNYAARSWAREEPSDWMVAKQIGHFDKKKLVLPDQSEEVVNLTKEFVNLTNLSDWSGSTEIGLSFWLMD